MGRKADPSRAHFDEVSEQTAGHGGAVKTRKFFECVHCGWKMQRSSFAADVGRAHLSANKDLAQDVCTGADDAVAATPNSSRRSRMLRWAPAGGQGGCSCC